VAYICMPVEGVVGAPADAADLYDMGSYSSMPVVASEDSTPFSRSTSVGGTTVKGPGSRSGAHSMQRSLLTRANLAAQNSLLRAASAADASTGRGGGGESSAGGLGGGVTGTYSALSGAAGACAWLGGLAACGAGDEDRGSWEGACARVWRCCGLSRGVGR
jgi:hypothetical protein